MDIEKLLQRFNRSVDRTASCWLWTGCCDSRGYGAVTIDKKLWKAHRLAWVIFRGDPGPMHVLHECDAPRCVNPNHLFLGTHADNMRDMVAKKRSSCIGIANRVLSKTQVIEIKRRLSVGYSQRAIASSFGVDPSFISHIKRGRYYAQIGA